jgi:hypothetical protein
MIVALDITTVFILAHIIIICILVYLVFIAKKMGLWFL